MTTSKPLTTTFEIPYDQGEDQHTAHVRVMAYPGEDQPEVVIIYTEDAEGHVTVAEAVTVTEAQWTDIVRQATAAFERWAQERADAASERPWDTREEREGLV